MASTTAIGTDPSAVSAPPSSAPPSTGGGGDTGAGAVLTDDQILGITSESGSEPSPEPSAAPAATQEPAAPAATAAPAELTIDDFKALFPTNPKVQGLWDKYENANKLITQFGTVADARKAADTIQMLGGVTQLESLAAKAADVDETDAVFFGGGPEDRKNLASAWYDGEGQHEFPVTSKAVADQIDATLEVMQQRDPQRYIGHLDRITRQALKTERFDGFMANLAQAIASGQGVEEAAKQVLAWAQRFGLDKSTNGQPSPEAQRLAQEREAFDTQRQTFQQQQVMNTLQQADTQLGTFVSSEIDRMLSELKVNGRSVFDPVKSKVALSRVSKEIRAHVDEALAKNPVFVAQGNSIKAKGFNNGPKEWVDMATRFAKLQLPISIKAIVDEWTSGVVSQANGAAERAKEAASRVDVGSGATPGSQSKPAKLSLATVRAENAKRAKEGKPALSDDDILNS